jgi:hypothetical protein
MGIRSLAKKLKLGRLRRIRAAPRWADIRRFGLKRARTRRIRVDKIKRWRRVKKKV